MEETTPKKDNFLAVSILVAALMVSASIMYMVRGGGTASAPGKLPAAVADSAKKSADALAGILKPQERDTILGNANAPVTIIEYGDYQCPFCGRFFSETEPLLRKSYIETGKAKMVYRNLTIIGSESVDVAEAAECAKDQGKFWAYHDELFRTEIKDGKENNGNLTRALFLTIAKDVGLNVKDFTSCYDGKKYAAVVKKETADAQAAGLNGTPTSYVNGTEVRGAQPFGAFAPLIDSFLGKR